MKLVEFFRQGLLWTIDASQLPRLRRWALHAMRRSVMSVELFLSRNLSAHAAALTYSSVLSAVPILAIIFAISRGFGFNQLIEEKLKANVRFTPEMTQSIMDFVNSYLERAKGGVFIGVGLVMLFYTLINLTSNIETAFNTIWQVKNSRNIYRRTVDYISVFFLLPVVIVVTSGLQIFLLGIGSFLPDFTFFNTAVEVLVQLSPYVLAVLAFILLYKMMPNTLVHWRATFLPGLFAGVAFNASAVVLHPLSIVDILLQCHLWFLRCYPAVLAVGAVVVDYLSLRSPTVLCQSDGGGLCLRKGGAPPEPRFTRPRRSAGDAATVQGF